MKYGSFFILIHFLIAVVGGGTSLFSENPDWPLKFSVNGKYRKTYTFEELKKLSSLISRPAGLKKGIYLEDLFPYLEELRSIRLKNREGGEAEIPLSDLPQTFLFFEQSKQSDRVSDHESSDSFYIVNERAPDPLSRAEYRHVESIDLQGRLPSKKNFIFWVPENLRFPEEEIKTFARLKDLSYDIIKPETIGRTLATVILQGKEAVPDLILLPFSELREAAPFLRAFRLFPKNSVLSSSDSFIPLPDFLKNFRSLRGERGEVRGLPFMYAVDILFYDEGKNIRLDPGQSLSLSTLSLMNRKMGGKEGSSLFWFLDTPYTFLTFNTGFNIPLPLKKIPRIPSDWAPVLKYLAHLHQKKEINFLTYEGEKIPPQTLFAVGRSSRMKEMKQVFKKVGLSVLPYNDRTRLPFKPSVFSYILAFPKNAPRPLLSRRLIRYLLSERVQQGISPEDGYLPASLPEKGFPVQKTETYKILKESYRRSYAPSAFQFSRKEARQLGELIRFYWEGLISLKEVLSYRFKD